MSSDKSSHVNFTVSSIYVNITYAAFFITIKEYYSVCIFHHRVMISLVSVVLKSLTSGVTVLDSIVMGYGTVRSKTSSSRDDSLQNHFSNGTVHPGTVRSICKKKKKKVFLRNENRF